MDFWWYLKLEACGAVYSRSNWNLEVLIVLLLNKLSTKRFLKREKLWSCQLCKISDESWQPTYIAGYLLCTDDG